MATPTVIPGQVVDPEGQPVAEARVFFGAGPAEVPDIAAVTSEEGRFSLTAPVPGDYTIVVAADGYAASETDVSASGGRNVDITIELRRAT